MVARSADPKKPSKPLRWPARHPCGCTGRVKTFVLFEPAARVEGCRRSELVGASILFAIPRPCTASPFRCHMAVVDRLALHSLPYQVGTPFRAFGKLVPKESFRGILFAVPLATSSARRVVRRDLHGAQQTALLRVCRPFLFLTLSVSCWICPSRSSLLSFSQLASTPVGYRMQHLFPRE